MMRPSICVIWAVLASQAAACAPAAPHRQLVVTRIEAPAVPDEEASTRTVGRQSMGSGEPLDATIDRRLTRIDPADPGERIERRVRPIDQPRSDEAFRLPVDEPAISSPFGMRNDPFHRNRRRMHRGVDFAGDTGTPVYATASGVALMAGYCDRGTGNCVVIEHAHGWRSQYFHLDTVHIRVNQHVAQGQRIGDIGSTGRSTGPHLHFQVGRDGEAVDPMTLIGTPLDR